MRILGRGRGQGPETQPVVEEEAARAQEERDVVERGPERRKLLFGERINPKWLGTGVPLLAASGLGVNEVLAGNDATPVTAGESNTRLVQPAPARMTLNEALAARGLALRLMPNDPIANPSPSDIRKGERLLKFLGFRPGKVDTRLTMQSRIAITEFQLAVGLEANGELTPQTLRKLETTANRVKKNGKGYLTVGMKGPEVKKLQQRLQKLGDFKGTPDGIYGESTAQAVLKFRARHGGLQDGVRSWSSKAQVLLMKELANIAHDPYRERVKPSKKRTQLDKKAAREARAKGIGPGSPPEVIRYVKEHLKRAGYDPNSTNGRWTDHTQAMMEQFLRRADLPVTERLTLRGWKRLSKSTIETNSRFKPKMRIGERSNAVLHLERDLRRAGEPIKPDRLYTKQTEKRVDHLRRHFGIRGEDGAGVRTHRLIHKRIKQRKEAQLIAKIPFYRELDPKLQRVAKIAVRMGLTVTSTTRGGHSPTSHHYPHNHADGKGHAIDVAVLGSAKREPKLVKFVRRMERLHPVELFYDHLPDHPSPGRDHFDHAHVAIL